MFGVVSRSQREAGWTRLLLDGIQNTFDNLVRYITEEDFSPVYVLKQFDNASNSLKNEFEFSKNEHADVKFFETTVLKDELGEITSRQRKFEIQSSSI